MRFVSLVLLMAIGLSGCSWERRVKHLGDEEFAHYGALKVWMTDEERKAYLKLKSLENRNAYLVELGLWDRFYGLPAAKQQAVLDGEVYRCALLLDVQTRLSDTPPPPGPTLFQAERRVGRLRRARSHYPHSLPPRPRPPRLAGGRRLDRDFRHARRHHRPRCGRRPPAGRARGGQHRAAPGGPRVRRGRVRLARPRRRALEGGPPPCRVLIGCPCRWDGEG